MEEQHKNFWTKLKGLFTKEEVKEQDPIILQQEIQAIHPNRELKECFYCKDWIREGDRWSKQMNNWFHRNCYKKFLQAGRRGKL